MRKRVLKKRVPTRTDLLIVIGRLKNIIGHAMSRFNDRNLNRQEDVDNALRCGHSLCIEALGQDPPILTATGPWAPEKMAR